MAVDLPHLHGILKDKTRARILELLEQRGKLSYTELQNLLEVLHTGKLNYHLKVLGDLISKDDQNGEYQLTEKGKVAVSLLGKFQIMAESSATALKAKLKLELALGVVGAMAALSLFFLLIGVPGTTATTSMTCSLGSGCTGSSDYSTIYTPTAYALVPVTLAATCAIGFYKRKDILVYLATAILFAFSFISLFSIGILYFPFGIALLVLIFTNRRSSFRAVKSV